MEQGEKKSLHLSHKMTNFLSSSENWGPWHKKFKDLEPMFYSQVGFENSNSAK